MYFFLKKNEEKAERQDKNLKDKKYKNRFSELGKAYIEIFGECKARKVAVQCSEAMCLNARCGRSGSDDSDDSEALLTQKGKKTGYC